MTRVAAGLRWLAFVAALAGCASGDDALAPPPRPWTLPDVGLPAAGSGGASARSVEPEVGEPRTSRPDGAPCQAPYLQVSAGASHTCALDREGCVVCVGDNRGDSGDYIAQAVPVVGRFEHIDAGREHTCGIRDDGTLACWGAIAVAPEGTYVAVTADYHTSCALRADGIGVCWGFSAPELPGNVELMQLVSGGYHACGILLDGSVQCWGDLPMTFDGVFARLAAESRETCGLHEDGSVDCGSSRLRFGVPAGAFVDLDVDSDSACAIRPDGRISCWGQLPEEGGGPPESGRFVQVSIGREPASAGSGHGCAIDEQGALHCWGSDRHGQIRLPD
jgi:alpha-tubulin suppressor-like RCC1 family protein